MTRSTDFTTAPDCTLYGPGDFVWMRSAPAIETDGIEFMPTPDFRVADCMMASGKTGREAAFVTIMLGMGDVGLHHAVTPEGAREIAAAIIRAADVVDGKVAGMAHAAIDAARSSGTRQ